MAASTELRTELSKAEYLQRYLSTDDNDKSKTKVKKKRKKIQGKGLKIVDDDVDWKQMVQEEKEAEEDEEEAPVIAEVIDDRPEDVKQMEVFKSSNRWKVIGEDDEDDKESGEGMGSGHPEVSPPRRARHDSPDASPPRRTRHDSPDISPPRRASGKSGKAQNKADRHQSPAGRRTRHDSDSDQSPPRKKTHKGPTSDADQSPVRRKKRRSSDSDQSPPRRKGRGGSDSDQSPPRRRPRDEKASDEDLSPPRRPGHTQPPRMLSGGKAGLVSVDVLRKEQEENRRKEKTNQPLEDESRNAQTVFRDKSGKKRDLDSEREEQKRKAGEKSAKEEKYAQWGRGLAQNEMQQQRLEDALREAQKPLARGYDDEDLDRMLREQEREGDPMAAMLRRKKDRNNKAPDKPRYKGPAPPPNRFNILPGYRWDGVNRSNGFEQKRYSRIADKKAVQEAAFKWSVEDM